MPFLHESFLFLRKMEGKGAGTVTFRDLCTKEIVQLQQGICLGKADDLELDPETARIEKLLLFGHPRLFGLMGREETLVIPWEEIEKIGMDAILVRTEVPHEDEPQGGKSLWERLRGWLKG